MVWWWGNPSDDANDFVDIHRVYVRDEEPDSNRKISKEEINMVFYGGVNKECIEMAAGHVASIYPSSSLGYKLIMETACAETALGTVQDPTEGAGMGLTQFDELPFNDVKDRSGSQRGKVLTELGIDIELVEWEHLRYNPLLAMLFCRLKYRLIPEAIPETLAGRAEY